MNERIKDIMGQAKFMAEESINKQISANTELYAFAEKFAELIVRECADYVDSAISDGGVDGRSLKEHFGVEE
jgi:hypothetical protein